ncbi:MAG: hypothetical protein KTR20_12365 [Cellvibrionaceae bacterium]|nr:hypothetical protein [Cellvibrionaceae bacterium]
MNKLQQKLIGAGLAQTEQAKIFFKEGVEIHLATSKQKNEKSIEFFVCENGLTMLAEAGMKTFVDNVGQNPFPYNLLRRHIPAGGMLPHHKATKTLTEAARFGGWLKAAASCPILTKVVLKTQSSKGVDSPHTKVDLWKLIKRFPSPHGFANRFLRVKKLANERLAPFIKDKKQSVSTAAIVVALVSNTAVGKAATIAVALHLQNYIEIISYKTARNRLVEINKCKLADNQLGQKIRREKKAVLECLGVQVYKCYKKTATAGGKLFMEEGHIAKGYGRTHYSQRNRPDDALQQALTSWRFEDKIKKENPELMAFLSGEMGFSPIFYPGDCPWSGKDQGRKFRKIRRLEGMKVIPAKLLVANINTYRDTLSDICLANQLYDRAQQALS